MTRNLRTILLATIALPSLSAQAEEVTCKVEYYTVVFEYQEPAMEPIFDKLNANTKSMRGATPEQILDATFGKGQYTVPTRNIIAITPDSKTPQWAEGLDNGRPKTIVNSSGKSVVVPTHIGWQFSYAAAPINGAIKTVLHVYRPNQTPITGQTPVLEFGWLAIEGESRARVDGRVGVVTKLMRTNCL
jgi:hypothetical protein